MTIPNSLRRLLGASLLCGAGMAVQAQNPVTFQIDMTAQSPTSVSVRGSFNGWGSPDWALTNNGAGIWSGTFNDTNAPGTVEACKFHYEPGDVWESDPNRQFVLAGGAQTLPSTTWNVKDWPVPVNNVTYQVDMTAQMLINAFSPGQTITVSGAVNGWGDGAAMTNDPALTGNATNIYSCVIAVSGFPGGEGGQYKFRANGGWENDPPGGPGNRNFTLIGGNQVLPVVYYNNIAPGNATNGNVTFRVDMTPQVVTGGFVNGINQVTVSGGMNGWGAGQLLTNNPAATPPADNIYSTVIPVTNFVDTAYTYKFRVDGGWESAAVYGVGVNLDRQFFLAGGNQTLPLVTYNDASLCDLIVEPTTTTFVLQLTNGTVAIDGTVFDPNTCSVHINGEFIGWQGWNVFLPQLVNNPPGSDYYEYTTILPSGSPRAQKFKFGIIGPSTVNADNEAPTYQDHISYIRNFGSSYTMATANFGTNYASTRVQPAFGNLAAGAPASGHIPLTWLGGPCVTLQVSPSAGSPSWTDLPATDAKGSTNWPNMGGAEYFRLSRRPFP